MFVSGDGNCLFNSLSVGLVGHEKLATEIRFRTCQLGLFSSRPVSQLDLGSYPPGQLGLFYLANCDAMPVLYM